MENQDFENNDTFLPGLLVFAKKISKFFLNVRTWWEQNSDTICEYLTLFAGFTVWFSAVHKLSEENLMFTDELTMDLAQEISETDNVRELLENYYTSDNYERFNLLVDRCNKSKCLLSNQNFFEEIISAYEREHFQLACTGLFALIDRVLADNTSDAKIVNFQKRIETIKNKMTEKVELDEVDKKAFCIYTLMNTEKGSIFDSSDFRKEEPELINRHWLLHDRTKRSYCFFDFLLVLLWLDAIIYMIELSDKET